MTVGADRPPAPTTPPAGGGGARWASLDAFRGVALAMMIAQHYATWTGGYVRDRFVGFDGFVVTDVCAPMFAIGVGAAAYLVGGRVAAARPPWPRAAQALRRWGSVLLLGVAIDWARYQEVRGGGVLLSLAALGVGVTILSAVGVRSAWAWWALAVGAAALTGTALDGSAADAGILELLWVGPFSVTTYGCYAAVGAALVAHAGGGGEAALPLWRAAAATVPVGLLLAVLVPSAAPDGLWPPSRHPGQLAFLVWGILGSLVLWAGLRALLPAGGRLQTGLARAGQRTLLYFGLHYCVRIVLGETDRLVAYRSHGEGLLMWLGWACTVGAAMLPTPAWWERARAWRRRLGRRPAAPATTA